jgi:hypothetical protein
VSVKNVTGQKSTVAAVNIPFGLTVVEQQQHTHMSHKRESLGLDERNFCLFPFAAR